MNRFYYQRLIVETIIFLSCLNVLLYQLHWPPLLWPQSQADLVLPLTVIPSPDDYNLGMIVPNLDDPKVDQLYNDLNLNFIRLSGIYPLPVDAGQITPKPNSSFPRSDEKVKEITQKQQPIMITLSPYKDAKDFDLTKCTGSLENLSCNFDALNLIPEIVKRLSGKCDFNNDGDCADTIYGTKETDGPIGRVKYFQIFNEPPPTNVGFFKGSDGPYYFAALVREFINKIELACADCQIGLAGFVGFRDDNQGFFSENLQKRKQYFDQTLDILGNDRNKLDFFDLHFHAVNSINNYYEYAREKIIYETFHQVLADKGLGQAPIWMTEISAYTESPNIPWDQTKTFPAKDEIEHALGLIRKVIYAYGVGFKKVLHSPIQDRTNWKGEGSVDNPCNNYFCHVGLVKRDSTPKIAYNSIKLLSYNLFPTIPSSVSLIRDDSIKIIKFSSNSQADQIVAWNDNGTSEVNLAEYFSTKGVSAINLISGSQTDQNHKTINLSQSPLLLKAYSPPEDVGGDEQDIPDSSSADSTTLITGADQGSSTTDRDNTSSSGNVMKTGTSLTESEIKKINKINTTELNLKVAKGAQSSQVNFSWNQFNQTNYYRLLRDNLEVAQVKENQFIDTILPGRYFRYQVIAYNAQSQPIAKSNILNLLLAGSISINKTRIAEIHKDRIKLEIQTNMPSVIKVDYQRRTFWQWLETFIIKIFKKDYQPKFKLDQHRTDQAADTSHLLEITNLKPGTSYHYLVEATNANNSKNQIKSSILTFKTSR